MAYFGLNSFDVQNIFEKNVTVSSGPIKCLIQSHDNGIKFVVAVSKQIKSKAQKHLIKRQIRSLVLLDKQKWQKWKLVFIIRKNYFEYSYKQIQNHLEQNCQMLSQKTLFLQ